MIDEQIRQGWKDYYAAIGAGQTEDAKRIFDRTSSLMFAHQTRRTTQRVLQAMPGLDGGK